MKQRITYFVPQDAAIDPKSIRVSDHGVNVTAAEPSAIEKRLTAGLSELPDELRSVLSDIHELHIRWFSRINYEASTPLISRLPSGLHAFFTPRKAGVEVDFCPLLKKVFSSDLKCHSVSESFSSPPVLSERFSRSSTYQYFHPLSRLTHFQTFLARTFCSGQSTGPCVNEAASLSYASYIDLDFDTISHAITLTAFWRSGIAADASRTPARKWRGGDSLEVGVLQPHEPDPEEPEELKLGGYLSVVGQDDKPSGTLFSFPSRHHPLPPSASGLTYSVTFQQPTGLHPKLDISLPYDHLKPPKEDSCAFHAYLTLPSSLFLDRYQLDDPATLAEHNLVSLRSLSGEQDLEAPEWVVKRWGSASLLELHTPTATQITVGESADWTATIPLHLRYLAPALNISTAEPGYVNLTVPWPTVFWACKAEEGLKMSTNPFDRVNLGFDGLFGPKTMFYHVPPAFNEDSIMLGEVLRVPVLESEWGAWVQIGTLVAIVLGFLWMVVGLGRVAWWDWWESGGEMWGARKEKKKQ